MTSPGPRYLRGAALLFCASLAFSQVMPLRSTVDSNGINCNGGSVMLGTPAIYVIWYGNWQGPEPAIVEGFLASLGGSPYEAIDSTYHDCNNLKPISGQVSFGGAVFDAYSHGGSLTDADIQGIVISHLGVDLPKDSNAIYFVIASGDVTSGFGSQFCGYHWAFQWGGTKVKYAFAGDPAGLPNPHVCEAQLVGPNGASGVDGIINIVAHEQEETITDPLLSAWYDSNGAENADKCAWTFGDTYAAANGALANMALDGRDYLVQRNWVNAAGGYCALEAPPPAACSGHGKCK